MEINKFQQILNLEISTIRSDSRSKQYDVVIEVFIKLLDLDLFVL